ncbi:hypothetical protein N431DRAFT_371507, partial [Stipitochalara longipes BDJ]
MDGLSALSVAASAAQFIEFSCSLVTKSKEIYNSTQGTLLQQVEIEDATRRLVELSERIKTSTNLQANPDSSIETDRTENQTLAAICKGCLAVSNQLLSKLQTLKVTDGQKHRGYKSFRQALKGVWSKGAIDNLAKRLSAFRDELDAHVLVSLSERFNSLSLLQDERYTSLENSIRTDIEPLLRELVAMHKKLTTTLIGKHTISRHANRQTSSHIGLLETEEKTNLALLDALKFPAMSHRRMEIATAHQRTFSWIFAEPIAVNSDCKHRVRPWSSYIQWLRQGSGIYWINGKAGSGKSTFMRYISNHPHTQESLKHWSPNADPQMASFYFWNSGTPLQRSQAGLLRSLLYDILRKQSGLIRSVFASEWESVSATVADRSQSLRALEIEFSLPMLEEAFISLSELASEDLKFCFFVDGLDEYDGDPERLIKLFTTVSKSPFVKVCLSSRPWLIFDEAFESCPSLRLQDLTSSDIRHYVDDKLDTNARMGALKNSDPASASLLVRTIVNKANGVFLWVYIVTRSILEGLRNHDSILDLQRRLDMLPSDLDALYSHMIRHMNPLYIEQASRIFQIYDAFWGNNYTPTILELELAVTADYSSAMAPPSKMTQLEIEDRCQRMAAHLKSRCEGLLEAH